ncbi:DUF3095 domain-containing protein [Allocoleopsis franciscana]|uniref:DUF3095 domain-containing protein n=1 Tax=Allocoleopsis franciscana PCC 7113 TaxID=1173027 RepID=K9WDM5_9CYAN|nr:DUF3095 domain-containing protein [Allocoleopsis franciscana]AFZ18338.1 Protein of unknown function (DUF3095) [Allocoleopsis franciscana PCC 7113]
MFTDTFYSELPTLEHFVEITNSQNFLPVHPDWYIVITDIMGSTQAIEAGRYKDVNILGVSSIIAILNRAKHLEIPFVFGGDGASLLIPPSLFLDTKQALLATQDMAKREFNLGLRVGIVPVATVRDANYDVRVAKVRVSAKYTQAVFTGGGLTYATELVKNPETSELYSLSSSGIIPQADFSGLVCPWQDIPSQHGEILSLIVMATAHQGQEETSIYKEAIKKIYKIYGGANNFHPVDFERIRLSLNRQILYKETQVVHQSQNWWYKQLSLWQKLLGIIAIKVSIKLGLIDWQTNKKTLISDSDYQKFDDILRMVISGNSGQREKLIRYLETQYKAGKLVYGFHVSDRALMTCLVYKAQGRHTAFIDGADGGYALAAKMLKEKLKPAKGWGTGTG